MDALVKDALKLDPGASDEEVLGKIAQLMAASGEEVGDPPLLRLVKAGQHEQCALQADGSIVVTLLVPVTVGSLTFSELTFHRPKLKDLRAAAKAGDDHFSVISGLLCALSRQAPRVIEELDAADVEVCSVVCRFLQERPPRTGPR